MLSFLLIWLLESILISLDPVSKQANLVRSEVRPTSSATNHPPCSRSEERRRLLSACGWWKKAVKKTRKWGNLDWRQATGRCFALGTCFDVMYRKARTVARTLDILKPTKLTRHFIRFEKHRDAFRHFPNDLRGFSRWPVDIVLARKKETKEVAKRKGSFVEGVLFSPKNTYIIYKGTITKKLQYYKKINLKPFPPPPFLVIGDLELLGSFQLSCRSVWKVAWMKSLVQRVRAAPSWSWCLEATFAWWVLTKPSKDPLEKHEQSIKVRKPFSTLAVFWKTNLTISNDKLLEHCFPSCPLCQAK